jgi:hypothetical protein
MAGAPKGNSNRKGRPGKKSLEIADKLAALNCDPIEGMARIALGAESGFIEKLQQIVESGDAEALSAQLPAMLKDLSLAGQMYKELAQYVAPKRKAIEHTGEGGKDLFPQQVTFKVIDGRSNPDAPST